MEIKKCSCGAEPEIEFGFSCTFKPKATIYCKKCGKSVQKIGFGEVSLFELWEKEVSRTEENQYESNIQIRLDDSYTAY